MIKQRASDNDELIEKLLEFDDDNLPKEQLAQTEHFLRRYYRQVPVEDLQGQNPQDLRGAALAHWQLARKRSPGEPLIRVYNPHFEKHGWQSTHTIVEVVTDDRAFLVDSMSMALDRLGLTIHLTTHPLMRVRRDGQNRLLEVLGDDGPDGDERAAGAGSVESFLQFQVDRQTDAAVLDHIREQIARVIADVDRCTGDWKAMRTKAREVGDQLAAGVPKSFADEVDEAVDLLRWLADDHFLLLGYCEMKFRGSRSNAQLLRVDDSALGLLRGGGSTALDADTEIVPMHTPAYIADRQLLSITKGNQRSTVHRRAYMDLITVLNFDAKGRVTGKTCFAGLFTSAAYRRHTHDIPLLRRKVAQVLSNAGYAAHTHGGKALTNILETYPRDAMFAHSADDVMRIAIGILHLQERQRVRLFGHIDPYDRYCTCLAYVPRELYSRELRLKVQDILVEGLDGSGVEFDTTFSSESTLARITYVIRTPNGASSGPTVEELEARIVEASRSWNDVLRETLIEQYGEERGNSLYSNYHGAFPPAYRDDYTPRTACHDISHLEQTRLDGKLGINFYRPPLRDEDTVNLKLYEPETYVALSDVLPLIENMGLRVDSERPYQIRSRGVALWLHEFIMRRSDGGNIDPDEIADKFQDAFDRVWRGEVENDGFNQLVIRAGLDWRETLVLRAYSKYLQQIRVPFSQSYMVETLVHNAAITRLLADLFAQRFDPAADSKRSKLEEKIVNKINSLLDDVQNLDEDRILRSFLNVIQATLRTNHYQTRPDGSHKPYLSFKFDPAKIEQIPLPRPMFEIFVASPRVEGVHLRGGRVARGGLRWSDRREDFRTEVLGLMKAQMVKNAVIVPVGSKGGFVCKQLPADRAQQREEVVECYRTFLRGMLDLTDNLVAGELVPPADVVRHDDDDPYLVIAADKGTATFSDIANSVAEGYGFWLGDAFASGGQYGYDHKGMGITARGAWESVKRHFRELGRDCQSEDFTVVGIGDMGGDVFGNGMLLSGHIRLLAAFNHLHIFIDPNPDAAKSFVERKRLFETPGTTWDDYDKKLISKGGGVWPRSAKSIPLSAEAQEALGIRAARMAPTELINALLKAPVDLLWNGGIGTYVKSSEESHADANDRANDGLRVDGSELRCKVIGEGGNLGLTQLARIEFSQHGGLINTDAIDNSAGVDCSDHEVNIKVLIGQVVDNGDMTIKQRNELLAAMTDEVGELVLRDNYAQTQAISVAATQAAQNLEASARFMSSLEIAGRLNRSLEYLPDSEQIAERGAAQKGLSRPELAVLLSYAKMTQYDALLDSQLPEDPYLQRVLIDYFPDRLGGGYAQTIAAHRLRREIIATCVTNEMINRVGALYPYQLADEQGASADEIARAFIATCDIFDMPSLWADIEALDNRVPAAVQTEILILVGGLVQRAMQWLIRHRRAQQPIAEIVDYFRDGIAELMTGLPQALAAVNRLTQVKRSRYYADLGVPRELAARIAGVVPLSSALDIVDIARSHERGVSEVASLYFRLGAYLDLQWLRDQISSLRVRNHWHHLARSGLRADLHAQQRNLTAEVLESSRPDKPRLMTNQWIEANQDAIDKFVHLVGELKAIGNLDFAMISLAVNAVHELSGGSPPK